MVDSPLELECRSCSRKFWYSGEKESPDSLDCPGCGCRVQIPEDA